MPGNLISKHGWPRCLRRHSFKLLEVRIWMAPILYSAKFEILLPLCGCFENKTIIVEKQYKYNDECDVLWDQSNSLWVNINFLALSGQNFWALSRVAPCHLMSGQDPTQPYSLPHLCLSEISTRLHTIFLKSYVVLVTYIILNDRNYMYYRHY